VFLLASVRCRGHGLYPVSFFENFISWLTSVEEEGLVGNFVREESRAWLYDGDWGAWVYDATTQGNGIRTTQGTLQLFPKGGVRTLTASSIICKKVIEW